MVWWDDRPVCAGAEARPWRAPRSAEESRRAYVRNPCARHDVYALRGVWAPAECDALAAQAEQAAAAAGGWSRARHASFPTPDIAVDALPAETQQALLRAVRERLLRAIAARAGFDRAEDLVLRDLFIVNYEAAEGGQAELELHRDGLLLSFNVLLSRRDAFEGGGTAFPHLAALVACDVADGEGVVRLAQGDACVHGGGVLHGGRRVTAGRRTLLVGFVDTARTSSATPDAGAC